MQWWEVKVYFEAEDEESAQDVTDDITLAACRGTGEGDDHVCRYGMVASGPSEITDECEVCGACHDCPGCDGTDRSDDFTCPRCA